MTEITEDTSNNELYLTALGDAIRDIRANTHMSQEEVSHDAGIAVSYYAKIEAGSINTSVKKLRVIAAALGVSVGQMTTQADNIYNSNSK